MSPLELGVMAREVVILIVAKIWLMKWGCAPNVPKLRETNQPILDVNFLLTFLETNPGKCILRKQTLKRRVGKRGELL